MDGRVEGRLNYSVPQLTLPLSKGVHGAFANATGFCFTASGNSANRPGRGSTHDHACYSHMTNTGGGVACNSRSPLVRGSKKQYNKICKWDRWEKHEKTS